MARTDERLRDTLATFLAGGRLVSSLSADVAASWKRVASSGLRPDQFDLPFDPDVDGQSRLHQASSLVMARLGAELTGSGMGLLLTDARAHVVERYVSDRGFEAELDRIQLAPGFYYAEDHAGTNGIGTALQSLKPTFVHGGEHFADTLTGMACAAVPITDPRTAQVVGVIDLSCASGDDNPLMLLLAKQSAWEIEQRLLEGASVTERALHEHFLQARRQTRRPFVLIGERTMLANTAASRLLGPGDEDLLRWWAGGALAQGAPISGELSLAGGRTTSARCEPVYDGGQVIGAIVHFGPAASSVAAAKPSSGWASLTDAERSVAELVAEGLTNRAVALRLFLSPYTVDAHLRHVFAKLGIGSRVELTRVVVERDRAGRSSGPAVEEVDQLDL